MSIPELYQELKITTGARLAINDIYKVGSSLPGSLRELIK
jgi:hypothetical protein